MKFSTGANAATCKTPPCAATVMIHHVTPACVLKHRPTAWARSEARTFVQPLLRRKERGSQASMPISHLDVLLLFRTTPFCFHNIPAAMTSSPRRAADPSPTMLGSTACAIHRSPGSTRECRGHPRAFGNCAHYSRNASSFCMLLMENILVAYHGAAHNDCWDWCIIEWTSTSPLHTATNTTPAKAVLAALVTQPPWCLMVGEQLETEIALPSLRQDLFCGGEGSLPVL